MLAKRNAKKQQRTCSKLHYLVQDKKSKILKFVSVWTNLVQRRGGRRLTTRKTQQQSVAFLPRFRAICPYRYWRRIYC